MHLFADLDHHIEEKLLVSLAGTIGVCPLMLEEGIAFCLVLEPSLMSVSFVTIDVRMLIYFFSKCIDFNELW